MRKPLRTALAAMCLAGAAGTTLWPLAAAAAEGPSATTASPATLAPELAQLREQVAQLRQILERFDQRLQQIQNTAPPAGAPAAPVATAPLSPAAGPSSPAAPVAALPASPAGPVPPVPSAALADTALDAHQQAVLKEQVRTTDALNAWQGLHNGMGQDEVRRLLGEPQSTMTVGNRTGWIYTYRNAGKGSVFFNSEGTVVSLIGPGQGALHLY